MLKTLFAIKNEAVLSLNAADAAVAIATKQAKAAEDQIARAASAISLVQRLNKVALGGYARVGDCFEITMTNKTEGPLGIKAQFQLEMLGDYPILRSNTLGIVIQLGNAEEVVNVPYRNDAVFITGQANAEEPGGYHVPVSVAPALKAFLATQR